MNRFYRITVSDITVSDQMSLKHRPIWESSRRIQRPSTQTVIRIAHRELDVDTTLYGSPAAYDEPCAGTTVVGVFGFGITDQINLQARGPILHAWDTVLQFPALNLVLADLRPND